MPSRRILFARFVAVTVVISLLVLGSSGANDMTAARASAAQQASLQDIMRDKLEHGQGLLRAVFSASMSRSSSTPTSSRCSARPPRGPADDAHRHVRGAQSAD